jgi:hypothetical protein
MRNPLAHWRTRDITFLVAQFPLSAQLTRDSRYARQLSNLISNRKVPGRRQPAVRQFAAISAFSTTRHGRPSATPSPFAALASRLIPDVNNNNVSFLFVTYVVSLHSFNPPASYPQHIHNRGLDTDRDNSVQSISNFNGRPSRPSPLDWSFGHDHNSIHPAPRLSASGFARLSAEL